MTGLFITATGTGVGKTFVTRGLARALVTAGHRVAALKPIETGVTLADTTSDAAALARACRRPELAHAAGFYRAARPVAPRAAELAGEPAVPSIDHLVKAIREASSQSEIALVEGAGGICVPLRARTTFADLAVALRWPILVVAPDTLGVLSHVITAVESAERRSLHVAAVVLARHPAADESRAHNAIILAEETSLPIRTFPAASDDDDALAAAATAAGLPSLVLDRAATRTQPDR